MSRILFLLISIALLKSFSFALEPNSIKYAKKLSTLYNNTRLPIKIDNSTKLTMVKSDKNEVHMFYKMKGLDEIPKQKIQESNCRKLKFFLNNGVIIKSIYRYDTLPDRIITLKKNDCN